MEPLRIRFEPDLVEKGVRKLPNDRAISTG